MLTQRCKFWKSQLYVAHCANKYVKETEEKERIQQIQQYIMGHYQ